MTAHLPWPAGRGLQDAHDTSDGSAWPATILVVEDDPLVAQDIRAILLQLGYRVPGSVATGQEALAAVEKAAPSLVLLDIELKGAIDGAETASRLREQFGVPVVCTASQEAPYALAYAAFSFACLLKPFNARELHTAIEHVISLQPPRERPSSPSLDGGRRSTPFLDVAGDSTLPPSSPGSSRRGRVLVLDPDPALTAAVQRVLGRTHDVVAEHDAEGALACIAVSQPFDLVLCDLGPPGMSGIDVYQTLAASHPDTASRVVFLGCGPCPPRAQRILESIANPFLAKPFSAERLRGLASDYVG